jgi:hypothetical protein
MSSSAEYKMSMSSYRSMSPDNKIHVDLVSAATGIIAPKDVKRAFDSGNAEKIISYLKVSFEAHNQLWDLVKQAIIDKKLTPSRQKSLVAIVKFNDDIHVDIKIFLILPVNLGYLLTHIKMGSQLSKLLIEYKIVNALTILDTYELYDYDPKIFHYIIQLYKNSNRPNGIFHWSDMVLNSDLARIDLNTTGRKNILACYKYFLKTDHQLPDDYVRRHAQKLAEVYQARPDLKGKPRSELPPIVRALLLVVNHNAHVAKQYDAATAGYRSAAGPMPTAVNRLIQGYSSRV